MVLGVTLLRKLFFSLSPKPVSTSWENVIVHVRAKDFFWT